MSETIRYQGRDVCINWYKRKVGPLPESYKAGHGKKCSFSQKCMNTVLWRIASQNRDIYYCNDHKQRMITEGRDDPSRYIPILT